MVDGIVKVNESLINIDIVRKLSKKYLKNLNVNIYLNNFVNLTAEFKNNMIILFCQLMKIIIGY